MGWPLDNRTEGGGFLYHAADNKVFLGLIVALNYRNPHLAPFEEFQRWKQHPRIREYLVGGNRLAYGARAVNKGGLQSLPKLVFPRRHAGGLRCRVSERCENQGRSRGDQEWHAGGGDPFTRRWPPAIRVMHSSIPTLQDFASPGCTMSCTERETFRPACTSLERSEAQRLHSSTRSIFRGRLPFTLAQRRAGSRIVARGKRSQPIDYPKPDGVVSFDRLSSVFLSSTNHEEDQPSHLKLKDAAIPIDYNLPKYDEPAQRYCPAGVYEVVTVDGEADSRSMRKTACTAKPATSRIRSKTSSGLCPKGAVGQTTPVCRLTSAACEWRRPAESFRR